MFRLNTPISNKVEIIGMPNNKKNELIYQLEPFIIQDAGPSNYHIIVDKDYYNCCYCSENILYIRYCDDTYLMKTVRQAIRDILYFDYLDNEYTKIHASAVKKDDDVYMIIGPKRAGKTSTALGLCKYYGYSLISGDLVLVKDKHLVGWATSIGVRGNTAKILSSNDVNYNNDYEMIWAWPNDYIKAGYNFEFEGKIKKIIIPKYNFNLTTSKIREIDIEDKKRLLLDNIHYEEINKNNYWNEEKTNLDDCRKRILDENGLIGIDTIEYISNGLSEKNIKKLCKILVKE